MYLLDPIGDRLDLWHQRGDGCRSWFDGTSGIFTIATILIAGCATVYSWLVFWVQSWHVSKKAVVSIVLVCLSYIVFPHVVHGVLNNGSVAVDAPEYVQMLMTTMNLYLGIHTVAAFVMAGRKTQ